MNVLICRPEPGASELAELLYSRGVEATVFPTMEIIPLSFKAESEHRAVGVFVSQNAVRFGVEHFLLNGGACAVAVGVSTAAALCESGVEEVVYPEEHFDSEHVLALPVLQDVSGQKCVVYRGLTGRSLIQDSLRERGADVIEVVCYETRCPKVDVAPLVAMWKQDAFDMVVCTSQAVCENLITLLGGAHFPLLQDACITVTSERMGSWAQQAGLDKHCLLPSPQNSVIVDAVLGYYAPL